MDEAAGQAQTGDAARGGVIHAIARQMAQLRHAYPDLGEVSADFLFVCYLVEYARLGRFEYDPISIEVRVVEDQFEREYPRLAPGQSPLDARLTDSYHRFYRALSAEVARSGRRRVDELHWLMAFLRLGEGLPARVFGELGVTADDVERFSRHGPPQERAANRDDGLERLYSPEEIAEYLGVHVQTVRAWVRAGRLPARRILGQRALRIRKSDLDAVLLPVNGTDNPGGEPG